MVNFKTNVETILDLDYNKTVKSADIYELYNAVSKAAMKVVDNRDGLDAQDKKVAYFSAEFMIGRLVYSNLLNLGLMNQFNELMTENGIDTRIFEDIEDAALGNGGLGRLAACFLDSGATINITLNGYGIRYKYGLFKQYFENGFQMETADDWQKHGDPWSTRRDEDKVIVNFKGQSVYAVPYDTPIIGYGGKKINTLRLWQAEPIDEFDFEVFNSQKHEKAFKERCDAEVISSVLYPNDDTDNGKQLRIKQQYFFTSASIKDMIKRYKNVHGTDFTKFSSEYAIQLNDTHPVVAIPEFIRIMMEDEGLTYKKAFKIARETFAYTNHTVMAEALEKWSVPLFRSVIPGVYRCIVMINKALIKDLQVMKLCKDDIDKYQIIDDNGIIHMARLAIYATHSINGVAWIHTEILKNDVLKDWYKIYPDRFNNKTNGITQRRWLLLSNKELTGFIIDKIGNSWVTNLDKLKGLERYIDDKSIIKEFDEIKNIKKRQLAEYILKKDKININPNNIYDIQVKRLHEYKRQLLNAFSILDIYFGLKDGRIKKEEFYPTTFIFGAKAAPGYYRAKGIIKYINEIAKMIDEDGDIRNLIQVVFISNYCVSYAEKITPAADISEQISTAGTEASGTGNMKFMLNGAVTLGTFDGANVEIVQQAGEENNYIFGARVEDIKKMSDIYSPKKYYENEPRIKKVVDTLVDGTFSDNETGIFKELFDSLLYGTDWHLADNYYLLMDFIPYCDIRLKANRDYFDRIQFRRKGLINTANAGKFSSDRTIFDYASDIWKAI